MDKVKPAYSGEKLKVTLEGPLSRSVSISIDGHAIPFFNARIDLDVDSFATVFIEAPIEKLDASFLQEHTSIQLIGDSNERDGEIGQLKLMLHWAQLHDHKEIIEYAEHVLKSLEQNPDQPLASQTLKLLEKS